MTDDVYRERARLVANLAAQHPSHMGFTDPNEPEWAVVIVETPQGQMSWHVAPADQGLFNHVRRTRPTDRPWDGHTTDEKYERLARLTRDVYAMRIRGSDVSRETRRLNLVRDYAREGFNHYRAHANETTHDGRLIPEWDQLGPEVQGHWSAAANRILWLAAENPDDVSRETFTDYSPEGVARWMDSLGRTAFEAYREHVGGVTYNGLLIPTWDEIAPETREAWTWSAMTTIARHVTAVASDVSRETSPEGDTDG